MDYLRQMQHRFAGELSLQQGKRCATSPMLCQDASTSMSARSIPWDTFFVSSVLGKLLAYLCHASVHKELHAGDET
jgi:hypothetical protein